MITPLRQQACARVIVLGLLLWRTVDAQGVSHVQPSQPRWGDTLSVRYAPPGSKSPRQVTAVVFLYFPGEGRTVAVRLAHDADGFHGTVALPSELSNGIVHFVADGTWDESAAQSFVMIRPDGKLARGAHGAALSHAPADRRDALLAESLTLYPDLVEVYRDRWLIGRETGEAGIEARIRRDLVSLSSRTEAKEDALLYTRLSGFLLVGEFAAAFETLHRLVDSHPDSPYTGRALQRYRFERLLVRGGDARESDQIAHWTSDIARRFPKSSIARENLFYFVPDTSWSLAAIDSIVEPWAQAEPRNPLPPLYKAEARVKRNVLAPSDASIRLAVAGMLEGYLFHYGTLDPGVAQDRIRDGFDTWSRAALLTGDSLLATALATAASALRTPTNSPEPALLAARLWDAAGQLRIAEDEYVRAVNAGAPIPTGLRDIYSRSIDIDERFENYLDIVARRTVQSSTPRYLPAFEATSLSGTPAGSQSFRGHVVVLNFFFTSCLPCLSEIPKLNSLMVPWSKQGVRFVAYALDDAPALRRFLKENPFHYQIVAGASGIADRFGVEAYPLHVVLDRQGRVRMVVKGGEPGTLDELRAGIASLVAEPVVGHSRPGSFDDR